MFSICSWLSLAPDSRSVSLMICAIDFKDDRFMKNCVAPPRFPVAHNKMFRDDGRIDL